MSTGPDKWNQRYRASAGEAKPCSLLIGQQRLLPEAGTALDLACGLGGNALFLARRGLHCTAIDYSSVALDKLQLSAQQQQLAITTVQQDLEPKPRLKACAFDVVVVSYYLHRPLFEQIKATLKPGGLLFYQTFNQRRPEQGGPQNPDFLLAEGELEQLCSGLEILVYSEDYCANLAKPAQSVGVFRKPH